MPLFIYSFYLLFMDLFVNLIWTRANKLLGQVSKTSITVLSLAVDFLSAV